MSTYTATVLGSLSTTTPTEGASPPSEINDAIREIKTVLLNQLAYDAKSALTVNAAVTESFLNCDATTGNVTVNLPAASTAKEGKVYTIKKTDASANTVTVDASGSETIDGSLTFVIHDRYEFITVYCTGTAWEIIGNTVSATSIEPAAGTKMLFYQDTAPTGWTIDTALNDKLVFITKGSAAGGQTGGAAHTTGTWTFSGLSGYTDYYTLTVTDIPAHAHSYTVFVGGEYAQGGGSYLAGTTGSISTGSQGGGGGHRHGLSSISHSGNWRPAAYNCIICSKN